jgi:lipoprotein-anchoring transpeptidase ErfK/SrfK
MSVSSLSRRGSERRARFFHCVVAGVAALFGATAMPRASAARDLVAFPAHVEPGTIVISARQRKLFLVVREGVAIRYPVAVPRAGKEWSGSATVDGKFVNPDWVPPPIVKRDHPELPNFIQGGSPRNPMGVRALTLDRFQVAIHGTTNKMRSSIGSAASYGCIRMLNEDVTDLYERVSVGTPVVMMQ